ncbi:GTPase-associated system all-helical protein GASH [Rufibacter latericius]|uniref:GTPase-associated system helical domain-containing protein n=1 Tax=Rufibacter latericius TaxID=2487040 RepID=A0A3M9MCT1_9BACT|nr:GTPase-associated system all-helical protein GASH [Rufibacter latericius]RNI23372.1 hypothetical protein EFB08_17645 [Rufibacter latericius]
MLQELINEQVLIITDDSYFVRLKKASDELSKRILKNKESINSFVSVALDPKVAIEDPIIDEVKGLIVKNWPTFLSFTKDTPVTFIRAVILEALEFISKDLKVANKIWLSGRNTTKYFSLVEKERNVVQTFLNGLGSRVEQDASKTWSVPKTNDLMKIGEVASAVSDEVKRMLSEQTPGLPIPQGEINSSISKVIGGKYSLLLEQNKMLHLRTQMLWWKESLFSVLLKVGYDEISSSALPLVLALDGNSLVPQIFPKSVDYFIKEVQRDVQKMEEGESLLVELIEGLVSSNEVALIRKNLNEPLNNGYERISLLDFIGGLISGKYKIGEIEKKVGVSLGVKLRPSEFGLWLFHDLQSAKLI